VGDLLEEGGHGLAMWLFARSSKSSFEFAERNERHRQYKKNSPGLVLLRSQISGIAAGPPKGFRTCQSVAASDHTWIGMPRNATRSPGECGNRTGSVQPWLPGRRLWHSANRIWCQE